ncbi:GATA zinc finger domain-containing protein 14-like [Daktulosphaira vitifoliae]|uniref:GATA zinc finger domain-containing protein 14-like n=1 Tax=Daktulosphaira vitifoliae TaxID=58002 RepID=UPI0021AA707C|nr:GATA zinc finger domain-containing protein 14-like [Daktulosphaira vitifoliae]
MKVLCLLVSIFVAIAVVGAHSNDRLNGLKSQEILHQFENKQYNHEHSQQWNQKNNDRYWYNKGHNLKNDVEYHHTFSHNHGHRQQRQYQNVSYNSDLSSGSVSSELNFNEEYIQSSRLNQNDAAYIVGNTCAKKIMKFYSIIEKYINSNGQIQNDWFNETVEVQQVVVPLPNHQFLNINESKINGLQHGTIKLVKVNTEYNNVEVDYHFNDLLINGNFKTNNGQKGYLKVKMLNTDVCVTTELYNKNLKTVDTFNEKLDMNMEFASQLENDQLIYQNAESSYLRNLKRTFENKLYEGTYNGLIGCMRHEVTKEFSIPSETITNMEIYNKKTGFKVILTNGQFQEESITNTNKIASVVVRPTKSGNGYRFKVNIVLAKQPSWKNDITVQKGEQQTTFRNVQFQANEIVATAILENVSQHMGGRQFRVSDVNFELKGLRFNLSNDKTFATELEQNLRHMIENNMAVVLKEQLKHEYQIYQQVPEQYNQCNRPTQQRLI